MGTVNYPQHPHEVTHPPNHARPDYPGPSTYTFSQQLLDLEDTGVIPNRNPTTHRGQPTGMTLPAPELWTPKFTPEAWIYTDGSDIKGQARLGAAVVHIPSNTTIYIDAAGSKETRIIMRAELIAIHTALTRFHDHPWLGIFTDSLSSLHAIRLHYNYPGISTSPHYHHHMLLLKSIYDLLEIR